MGRPLAAGTAIPEPAPSKAGRLLRGGTGVDLHKSGPRPGSNGSRESGKDIHVDKNFIQRNDSMAGMWLMKS
jgi:hypothetical protein